MALAILEWMDADESQVWFRADTGTNTLYQLKVGAAVRADGDGDQVDDVYFTLPAGHSDAGEGGLFAGPLEISVPLRNFRSGRCYAQLFTSKAGGRAQAASEVILLAGLSVAAPTLAASLSLVSRGAAMNGLAQLHRAPRQIPNRLPQLAAQTSLETLLGEIVKIASPVVMEVLKGVSGSAMGTGNGTSAGAGATRAGPVDLLGQVLKSLLAALSGPAAGNTNANVEPAANANANVAAKADPNVSKAKSVARAATHGDGNRFFAGSRAQYAQPFIFGIDDALIASLIGPIVQILPQLANAANQKRIELKKADNQLVSGIISDINKRLMMDKVLEAQAAAQKQGAGAQLDPAQLQALTDLLAQLPAGTSTSQSLAMTTMTAAAGPGDTHTLSNRAVLSFTLGSLLEWNGSRRAVFDRNRVLVLKPRFVVAEPSPKLPLPKAILKLVLQDAANPDVRLEKTFKLTGVAANSAIDCAIEPSDLAHLPQNALLNVLAELRWQTARGGETRAYGSAELVLVNKYFLKSRGAELSAERELTDMTQYRPFWNKIWEAPVLDATRADRKKYSWELNVNGRYAVVLGASHDSNGLMETKLLQEAADRDSLTQTIRGRMKAGIELSVAELNKLIPAWPGNTVVDAAKLEALSAAPFLDDAARELKYNFRLKGRAGQGGMIWVIPTFKLFGLTVSTVAGVDDSGQVSATSEELIPFPLPAAARLIGLKSAA